MKSSTDSRTAKLTAGALALWAVVAVIWTFPSLQLQLEYFRNPGPRFYQAFLVVAPLVLVSSLFYAWARQTRSGLRAIEPWLGTAIWIPLALVQPTAVLACLAIAASAYCAGRTILEAVDPAIDASAEREALALGAGLAAASSLLFVLGQFGWLSVWTFAAMTATPIILWGRKLQAIPAAVGRAFRAWPTRPEQAHPLVGLSVFFLFLCGLSGVAVLLAPPVAFDAINFHLPLAKTYAVFGSLPMSEAQPYAYYPQGFEVLLSWAYGLGGVRAAQFFGLLFFGLTLVLAGCIGRRCGVPGHAILFGTAAAACAPAFHSPAFTAKNDMATAAYALSAVALLFRWRESGRSAWLLGAVGFLGASFGTKHTALFAAAPIGAFLLAAILLERRRFKLLALAAVIWLGAAGCWHLRTFRETGSPVYPNGAGRIASKTLEGSTTRAGSAPAEEADLSGLFLHAIEVIPEAFADAHLRGWEVFESVLPAPLGAFLVLFLPFVFLPGRERRRKAARWVGAGIAVSMTLWVVVMSSLQGSLHADVTVRYVHAALLLWFVLLAPAAIHGFDRGGRISRVVVAGAAAYSFLLGWSGLLLVENSGAQLQYLAGRMSEEEYLAGAQSPYQAVRAVAAVAAPGDDVLSLGGCAALYYPEPWRFNCYRRRNFAWFVGQQYPLADYKFLIVHRFNPYDVAEFPAPLELFYEDKLFRAFRILED